ncbi:MAG: chaperone modulator CbpM [Williamsia sp.]|nr:chaperone modulator CbpM [Williamsia sp.]
METPEMIPVAEFCAIHQIEGGFIDSLQSVGLIEVTMVEDHPFIPAVQLLRLEQLVRMHFDLDINLEGMDAILHLLDRVQNMQAEIRLLKNRLRLYETE